MIRKFLPAYFAIFFLSFHYAAVLYINSSFLSEFFSLNAVSFLFILGAIGNFLIFIIAPRFINYLGIKKFFFLLIFFELLAIGSMALSNTQVSAGISFIFFASISLIIFYVLDIFLEGLSVDSRTGEIRGSYLTMMNLAIALAPLLLSALLLNGNYSIIYFASLLLLIPLFIIGFFFKSESELGEIRHHSPAFLPWKEWLKNDHCRRSTLARFVLEFFFTSMVIYSPIYLNQVLGFEWQVIGVIFTFMLLPFIIFQWPVGEMADRFYGEKEFMLAGFIFIALTLILMPFLPANAVIWAIILFLSRVGASFVEVTTESYFFKQINENDTGLIGIFRLSRTFGIIFGATIGALLSSFFFIQIIFLSTALVVVWGFTQAGKLEDTL